MSPDTVQHVLPYEFHKLPRDRAMIIHPQGAKLILHKSQILLALETGKSGEYRELSAHEVLMLEAALKVLDE